MTEVKPDTPKLCPWCGKAPKVEPERPDVEGTCWGRVKCTNPACPVNPSVSDDETMNDDRGSDAYKARAIELWNMVDPSAKLAAAEARVRELEEGDEALLAVLPEDFGAVEYIKHLTAANAALEEKLAEVDEAFEDICEQTISHLGFESLLAKIQQRQEARKKGAEHE